VDGPEAVVGLLEADRLIDQGLGEVEEAVLKMEGPAGGDLLDQEMAGVVDRAGLGAMLGAVGGGALGRRFDRWYRAYYRRGGVGK